MGIADSVRIAQDKNGMLRRALERIIQLYTDKSHFVYELLQNAEDAEAKCVKFVQYQDRLEVLHDGRPFTTENLQGLCDIGKSDKVYNLNQIGEFGVGFKSVFGICDTVRLYSNPDNFRIKNLEDVQPFAVEIIDFTTPKDIPMSDMENTYTTRFVFPYTVGRTFSGFKSVPELKRVLSQKLQNLGITTLLFMKSLEIIEYQIMIDDKRIEGEYLLEKEQINDHCSLVSALGHSDSNESNKEASEEISYIMFSRPIDRVSKRTVDIAFPVVVKEDKSYECKITKHPFISVYFPTETESKLGFIVQGPYRTTPNRSSIPADEEANIFLAKITAGLLRDALIEMRDTNILNMSFLKVLPLTEKQFDNYKLFYPLYETVRTLFVNEDIIPCKNGGYISAYCAKIARQEKLASLFSDKLLTKLINDRNEYRWLPTYLTETNKEYERVYRYLTSVLRIQIIRPEDLRLFFNNNTRFLPKQSDDWLVGLYTILENVGAAFTRTKNENNFLTANIIKTKKGDFVAAYRKTENKQYIANVFLFSDKIESEDIIFVDPKIYQRCKHFFDNILQIQEPNEYEFIINDIKKRYNCDYIFDAEKHIKDIKNLHKYLKYDGYKDEIRQILEERFVVKCSDGKFHNCFMRRVYLPNTSEGYDLLNYFKNIDNMVLFVDIDFYSSNNVSIEMLIAFGVRDSIFHNENTVKGVYYTGFSGRQPEWWTMGDFRWKLTIDNIKEVLRYISKFPERKDSIIKSKTIFSVLLRNESKLCGTVFIGGTNPNLVNVPCEMVKLLSIGFIEWDRRWVYTESMELVSTESISKAELSTSIYGNIKPSSSIYELLGFRKTEADEIEELKKTLTEQQVDAFFNDELKKRYGISEEDLTRYLDSSIGESVYDNDSYKYEKEHYEFPSVKVKNWEALRKHAAEMLCFANPVKYDYAIRRIRVSNKPKEARAYLLNMYRYDGIYKYACQMCHDTCSDIEATQLFNNPELELDPMNLCLCPNCATLYRQSRNDSHVMDIFKRKITNTSESEITSSDFVTVEVDGQEIWFTQTHFAEIQALIRLAEDVKNDNQVNPVVADEEDTNSKEGLSVYSSYVGKTIKRKDGFTGKITKVDSEYMTIKVINASSKGNGPVAGDTTKISLQFFIGNPNIYQVIDN